MYYPLATLLSLLALSSVSLGFDTKATNRGKFVGDIAYSASETGGKGAQFENNFSSAVNSYKKYDGVRTDDCIKDAQDNKPLRECMTTCYQYLAMSYTEELDYCANKCFDENCPD